MTRIDSHHLSLLVVLILSVAATVALTVAGVPVPPVLTTLDTAAAGALFGVTVPGGRGKQGGAA